MHYSFRALRTPSRWRSPPVAVAEIKRRKTGGTTADYKPPSGGPLFGKKRKPYNARLCSRIVSEAKQGQKGGPLSEAPAFSPFHQRSSVQARGCTRPETERHRPPTHPPAGRAVTSSSHRGRDAPCRLDGLEPERADPLDVRVPDEPHPALDCQAFDCS